MYRILLYFALRSGKGGERCRSVIRLFLLCAPLQRAFTMSGNTMTFTNDVICWKELIDKEQTGHRVWKEKWGPVFQDGGPWRPVEPFERSGASEAKGELPAGIPGSAIRNPKLYRDHVGKDGLAGGTPNRFGGQWDLVSERAERWVDPDKPPNVVKKGPHDCYCDIGYNCESAGLDPMTCAFELLLACTLPASLHPLFCSPRRRRIDTHLCRLVEGRQSAHRKSRPDGCL